MPRYSGVTFGVQPVEIDGIVQGYVFSGFLTKQQLLTIKNLVDSPDYERSKRWRGEYQEMAKAIIEAVDSSLD